MRMYNLWSFSESPVKHILIGCCNPKFPPSLRIDQSNLILRTRLGPSLELWVIGHFARSSVPQRCKHRFPFQLKGFICVAVLLIYFIMGSSKKHKEKDKDREERRHKHKEKDKDRDKDREKRHKHRRHRSRSKERDEASSSSRRRRSSPSREGDVGERGSPGKL